MGIHKGTKLTDNPKNKMIRVRMDEGTTEKLDYLSETQKTSKSEVIRKGIEIQYEQSIKEKT